MKLLSIQVGRPQYITTKGRSWFSGYIKEEVPGPVFVGRTNLDGDGQADLRHHGGPDRAVLAYSAEHYPRWAAELAPVVLPHGGLGENLTISGQDESTVCVGDIYAVGPEVVLQVSQPRMPCANIARRWEVDDLTERVLRSGRSGWYLRVIKEGEVAPGMEVRLLERPHPEWPVEQAFAAIRDRHQDREPARRLAACPALSADLVPKLNP